MISLCVLIALILSLLCHVIVAVVRGWDSRGACKRNRDLTLNNSAFFFLLRIVDWTRGRTTDKRLSCVTESDDITLKCCTLSSLLISVAPYSLNFFAMSLTLSFSVFPSPLASFYLQVSGQSASHVQLSVAMDACARIRGVPVRSRASVRKEVCLHCILFCNYLYSLCLPLHLPEDV